MVGSPRFETEPAATYRGPIADGLRCEGIDRVSRTSPSARTRVPGVIAFAKDWHEDPTSNHHVLRELAKSRRVLWLNSIGTRTPKLGSGRDLGKMKRKLAELARGPVNVENDLWVFSPMVLPLPHSAVARRINREILRGTIALLRRRLGIDDFHLWTFLPNVADYVGSLGESLAVYYCVDEWSLFAYLDRDATVAAERRLLSKVDCVFAINGELADAKRAVNPATHIAPHGVAHAEFARALDDDTVVPADIARLPKPVLGFYGTLRSWVDLDLVAHVARARPSWSIALIGQALDDVGAVAGLPNVHLLGRKPHTDLPAYCKGMDVGLIPYRIDERMKFVNPIKLREYLSAGLPVVSTDVPEVRRYAPRCTIADDGPAFVAAVESALASDSPARRRERSQAMERETWPMRVAEV
ncbi:MAG: glycosyltransferase, partial [Myxococcales bacterium]|nr:glycosyltransferase [Myxococcales bacterium]